jgi:hypothetical protein
MHRVTEESTHRECEWKRSAKGETADALSATQEPPRRLDKQCLLMEVRMRHSEKRAPDTSYIAVTTP